MLERNRGSLSRKGEMTEAEAVEMEMFINFIDAFLEFEDYRFESDDAFWKKWKESDGDAQVTKS